MSSRLMFASNEALRLPDTSPATVDRFLILKTRRNNYGKEDIHLFDKIERELDGVLVWALEGPDRLNANGRFTETNVSRESHEMSRTYSSPLVAFADEKLELGPEFEIELDEFYTEFALWLTRMVTKILEDEAKARP